MWNSERIRRMVAKTLLVVALLTASNALAQYKPVDLTPPGLPPGVGAGIRAVDGTRAVGSTLRNGVFTGAVAWDLESGSSTLLNSDKWRWSTASSISGDTVVGFFANPIPGGIEAVRWSWTDTGIKVVGDMNPPGATLSSANGTTGQFSGGSAVFENSIDRAMLWSHTGGNDFAVDINPDGYDEGAVTAMHGTRQVGIAYDDTRTHAVLWRLTKESAVSLHPTSDPDLYKHSWGSGVHGDQQVGWAGTGLGAIQHAILWRDTAESAVDLNPAGYVYSQATDTNGHQQVGFAALTGGFGNARAMVWSGSAASAVDLHQFLDQGLYVRSYAYAIDDRGSVYGHAVDATGVAHAMQWTPVPEPSTAGVMAIASLLALSRASRK